MYFFYIILGINYYIFNSIINNNNTCYNNISSILKEYIWNNEIFNKYNSFRNIFI